MLNVEVRYKEKLVSLAAKLRASFLAQTKAIESAVQKYYDGMTRYVDEREKKP